MRFWEPPVTNVWKPPNSSAPLPSQSFLQNNEAASSEISPKSILNHQPPLKDIDTTDFKLLHHFTTSTCHTLCDQAELQFLWQHQVPELAFSHIFLLRMILAISALHLCRITSDTHCLPYAHQQYEAALRSSSKALSEISPSNCHALYASAAIAFIFELGASKNNKCLLYSTDGVLAHWAVHVRGVRTIIDSSWHDLESGVLRPLFHRQFLRGGVQDIEIRLDQFAEHIRSTSTENDDLSLYFVAIQELVKSSKMVEVGFFAWMCQTTDEFVSFLAKKDPFALVIFAHSCVLLDHGEPRYWVGQWAKSLLGEVYEYLDPPLRLWIQWPLGKVN